MTKSIIICCDGTWNSADQDRKGEPTPTNIVRLAYRVAKRDPDTGEPQVLYYDQGVGTGNVLDRFTGGAFGRGLDSNVFECYRFLIANYEAKDKLFLFGFSRGAFTARSLAGLIRNSGILKRDAVRQYQKALALYRNPDIKPSSEQATEFRAAHSVMGDVPIHLIGVFDTVGSLGIPVRGMRWMTRKKYQFHDTKLSSLVSHAYHALAIDERRAPFEPTLFWKSPDNQKQRVEQVWFPGVHSDVGGGYKERDISDLTLKWMLKRVEAAGLKLEPTAFDDIQGKPGGVLHNSKKGMYGLTPGINRKIKLCPKDLDDPKSELVDDPTQSLHESVLQRWQEVNSYRPKSLTEYFARTGTTP
jgi:uncharacterized protein (DUF2235 family)